MTYVEERRKELIRRKEIEELNYLHSYIIFNDMNFYYAYKYEKIKEKMAKKGKTHSLREDLFIFFTYDLYKGLIPTLTDCGEEKLRLYNEYEDFLPSEYWTDERIIDILDLLNRRKAYTVKEAIAILQPKIKKQNEKNEKRRKRIERRIERKYRK